MAKLSSERAAFIRLMMAIVIAGSLVILLPAYVLGLTCVTTGNVTEALVGSSGTVPVWVKNIDGTTPADLAGYDINIEFDSTKVKITAARSHPDRNWDFFGYSFPDDKTIHIIGIAFSRPYATGSLRVAEFDYECLGPGSSPFVVTVNYGGLINSDAVDIPHSTVDGWCNQVGQTPTPEPAQTPTEIPVGNGGGGGNGGPPPPTDTVPPSSTETPEPSATPEPSETPEPAKTPGTSETPSPAPTPPPAAATPTPAPEPEEDGTNAGFIIGPIAAVVVLGILVYLLLRRGDAGIE